MYMAGFPVDGEPFAPQPFASYWSPPLTEADMRRIIREELARLCRRSAPVDIEYTCPDCWVRDHG
jgi:hypothetical protein